MALAILTAESCRLQTAISNTAQLEAEPGAEPEAEPGARLRVRLAGLALALGRSAGSAVPLVPHMTSQSVVFGPAGRAMTCLESLVV